MSQFIKEIDPGPTDSNADKFQGEAKRIYLGQSGGNNSRNEFGNDILALLGIKEIAFERQESFKRDNENSELVKKSRRVAHIIDSLKHPDEVTLLRSVYSNMFYLFGVLCAHPTRKHRLEKIKEVSSPDAEFLMKRDESEELEYGQKLNETLQYADFFIRNNHKNMRNLEPAIDRYIRMILGDPAITPTKEEFAMYMAQSAALRSACLSRQVGAAIMNEEGDIIATGCNDVPKSGGGLYSIEDGENDLRCMNTFDGKCWSVEYRQRIREQIKSILDDEINNSEIAERLSRAISEKTRVKDILEFSRSVHAEMDAIISVARNGNASLRNCALFCTTFPCHNCSRHIIASGIKKVYYIEPYEKSLALELYDDSIKLELLESEAHEDKVIFSHFEGVAPRQYLNLFSYTFEKKDGGKMIKHEHQKALPKVPKFMDTYLDYESKVISYLKEIGLLGAQEEEDNGQEKG